MVAQTKLSPTLLFDENDRRNRSSAPKNMPPSHCQIQRNGSFSEYSALSRSDSCDTSVSSSVSRSAAQVPHSSRIRSRYLNRLGISPASQSCIHAKKVVKRDRSSSRDYQEPSFQVDLKDHTEPKRIFSFFHQSSLGSTSSSDSKSLTEGERSVSFASSVTVHPIPKHTAYSSRIRETIWTNPVEMQESAARNCIEFAAENWDWRQVAEDQDMVYYQGELVHPVHFAHEYNIRRQFCQVMTAQSQASH